jgi:hypothetical protein
MVNISVLTRILIFGAIIAAGYWYWSGPWQEKAHPSYEALLEKNEENMRLCMRSAAFEMGATGTGTAAAGAREQCAEKYNLYELDGRWHSYDVPRPN